MQGPLSCSLRLVMGPTGRHWVARCRWCVDEIVWMLWKGGKVHERVDIRGVPPQVELLDLSF